MRLAAACWILNLAISPSPAPLRVCPADASSASASARGQESEANAQYAARAYWEAAALHERSADAYHECDKYHLRRMTAIERSVAALEEAHQAALETGDSARAAASRVQAIEVITRYLDSLSAAYPGAAERTEGHLILSSRRAELQAKLPSPTADAGTEQEPSAPRPATAEGNPKEAAASEAALRPVAASDPAPPIPARPWRGLAAAGGLALVIGTGMLMAVSIYSARNHTLQREYEDPINACSPAATEAPCADYLAQGKRENVPVIVGIVTAPLLMGAGIALITVAARRRLGAPALRPVVGRHTAGLVWEGRF